MARNTYKSEKRRKETARLKKQEEKRQRRFGAKTSMEESEIESAEAESIPEEGTATEEQGSADGREEGA
ncbi:MAG: hypothetical protein LBQ00_05965 [Syntrophobacterales bacterium]|nr:hypothetical protein [Syntrophobacterales bacterium]